MKKSALCLLVGALLSVPGVGVLAESKAEVSAPVAETKKATD